MLGTYASHGMTAWHWLWMVPMMFSWIVVVAFGVYVAVVLANRSR